MNSSSPATTGGAVGVLVLEEFACFQARDFIEFIGRSEEDIPNQFLLWHNSRAKHGSAFRSHYGRCDLVVRGKSINLHLFDFPMSLLPDFNLSDLIFPVEIRGCLLLANQEFDPSTWRKDRYPGWLDWIQAQKTTFLVALTGSDSPALPGDEFLGYLSLRPEIQVLEIHSHNTTGRYDHVFEIAEAKPALTTLIENIITNMAQMSE